MADSRSTASDNYCYWYYAEYLGGHAMHSGSHRCILSLFPTKVVISNKKMSPASNAELDLHIPYTAIKEVKNVSKEHVDGLRVLTFGVAGVLWKKKETCLSIVYNDGFQDQNLLLRVQGLEKAQKRLYENFLKSMQKTKQGKSETFFIVCDYCRVRYDANSNIKCPNCGAINSNR